MYLSQLRLDTRPHARGRSLLRDVYALHQRLWRAFTGLDETAQNSRPFLFRVETTGPARILVQSMFPPDWERAFLKAPGYIEDAKVVVRHLDDLDRFESCRFRLLANPVRTKHKSDDPADKRRIRRALSGAEELWDWLARHLNGAATIHPLQTETFGLNSNELPNPPKQVLQGRKPGQSSQIKVVARLFEGTLTVHDHEKIKQVVTHGIGRAKAFGCGLLSLAPA